MKNVLMKTKATPTIIVVLQVVVALAFALPTAYYAARSADQFTPVEVQTNRVGRSASLYLKKADGPIVPNTAQRLDIMIDSGGANINTVSLTITAPVGIVALERFSFDRSFCTIVTQQNVDSASGSATLSCGAPNPGLSTQIGTVATLFYQPLSVGPALFRIEPHTAQVLANDGLGSDVLKATENLAVTVQSNGGSAAETTNVARVPLTSTTHALGDSCSTRENAEFVWLPPAPGLTYEYDFSTRPHQIISASTTTRTSVTLPTQRGSVQYFNVRALQENGSGPISTVAISTCNNPGQTVTSDSAPASPLTQALQDFWSLLTSWITG